VSAVACVLLVRGGRESEDGAAYRAVSDDRIGANIAKAAMRQRRTDSLWHSERRRVNQKSHDCSRQSFNGDYRLLNFLAMGVLDL
jgi:hypothetical protein